MSNLILINYTTIVKSFLSNLPVRIKSNHQTATKYRHLPCWGGGIIFVLLFSMISPGSVVLAGREEALALLALRLNISVDNCKANIVNSLVKLP